MDISFIPELLSAVAIYHKTAHGAILSALSNAITYAKQHQQLPALTQYAAICRSTFDACKDFSSLVQNQILTDDNVYSRALATGRQQQLPKQLQRTAKQELQTLLEISNISFLALQAFLSQSAGITNDSLPMPLQSEHDNSAQFIKQLAEYHQTHGVGLFVSHAAFSYDSVQKLLPITVLDNVRFANLKGYTVQRQPIVDNTLALLQGLPYHNVLLYGDRGTGKSSTVKAILNEYKDKKLRMIELKKKDIIGLSHLLAELESIPLYFIVFIDDLTFEEQDESYSILKATLEGGLSACPNNVAIYATTNRKHILKETCAAREGGNAVHRADAIDDSLSLADRFGLTVTFLCPAQEEYFTIVTQLAAHFDLPISKEQLLRGAEQAALECGNRSPRTAKHYIDSLYQSLHLKF